MKNRIYFEEDNAKILYADTLNTRLITNGSIDLIVTSPPYNLDIDYLSHDDAQPYEEYLKFTQNWLKRCYKWLKDDGRMCLNIPLDKIKGGHQSVGADIIEIAKKAGFKYHATVIWNEGNISKNSAWGSWMSASCPYVIAPVELIVLLYKKQWKKTSGTKISDVKREEFISWTNGVWTFRGESKRKIGHPAPFPIELPKRCIKLFSFVGDTVLDPFMGSGSTVIAAKQNGRKGIGIDKELDYCELAMRRVLKETK